MKAFSDSLRDTPAGRFVEAYRNPRLENPEADYLDLEHLDELRDLSEITEWNTSYRPEVYPGIGTIHKRPVVTKQGYGYMGVVGVPETQRTDSLGLATSPLGTSEPGYNRHMLLNYMRAGNYVAFLAGEGSYEPIDKVEVRTRIALASSAAALLNFGYHVQQELSKNGHSVHEQNRFTYGPSRAGAIQIVENAMDMEFGQNIVLSDIIAPSPALKIDSKDQWQQVIEQIIKEPVPAALIVARLGLKLALRYRKSTSFRSAHLTHQLEICGGLFNGELDAAAARIKPDKAMRITEYDCDLTCNDGGLEERLTPLTHPFVAFELLPGIHMSIVDRPKTLPIMMGLNKAYQEYESGILTTPQQIYARARVLAPRQFPITKEQLPQPSSYTAA